MTQYVYGKHAVYQQIKSGCAETVYMAVKDKMAISLCQKLNVPFEMIDKKKLLKLSQNAVHQGILAKVKAYQTYTVDEIVASGESGMIVCLDEIEDPHNLGAILRTCDCVGVDGVIIKKKGAVGLNATVAKVSVGAINTVKVASVTNITKTLQQLKEKGYWIVGSGFENAVDYRTLPYDTKVVLVIGNEGKGLSRLVKETCDYMVKIPMKGKLSSLNASVATAVLLYEVHNKKFPVE